MAVYTADMDRTNIYLDPETRAAAQYIKEQTGAASDSAAIRFAVREIAMARGWQPGGDPPKPSRQRKRANRPEIEA
jgi:hypothetical protein